MPRQKNWMRMAAEMLTFKHFLYKEPTLLSFYFRLKIFQESLGVSYVSFACNTAK